MTTTRQCPRCHGSGVLEKHLPKKREIVRCWECSGIGHLGEIETQSPNEDDRHPDADAPRTLEARKENERKMKLACAERLRAEAEAIA